MFKRILHLIFPGLCVREARWVRGSLCCPCGDILALRYQYDGITRVFIYPTFRKYEKQISNISVGDGVIGAVCFDDFCDFMLDFKFKSSNTFPDYDETNDDFQEDIT